MGSNIFFTNVYVEYGIGLPWKYDEFARLAISIKEEIKHFNKTGHGFGLSKLFKCQHYHNLLSRSKWELVFGNIPCKAKEIF